MSELCPLCHGRGRIRSDAELDHALRLIFDAALNMPPGHDPEAGSVAGLSAKLGEPVDRIVAAMDRLSATPGSGVKKTSARDA